MWEKKCLLNRGWGHFFIIAVIMSLFQWIMLHNVGGKQQYGSVLL